MSVSILRRVLHLALLCVAVVSFGASAGDRPPLTGMHIAPSVNDLSQSYTWHDGEREVKVWLNPQRVAEFNPGKAGRQAVTKADAAAKEITLKKPQSGVRLWQLNNTGNAAVTGMVASNPAGKYSPVFHDGPSSSSAMRALPGNVIVLFDAAWSSSKVKSWLAKRNLQIVKKLNAGNAYLIKTNPGMETLDIAEALHQTGEVKAAYPDWWQEVETK